ncbi:MAG TPA: DUF4129 domain-containing protein [Anaerolineae bacterium]|nr:DUF4129 domain-containing protein [Anaerolineae bacterium]HQJ50179.1 DUF4129 domain-containing protein [Anaerolineae bacterium]
MMPLLRRYWRREILYANLAAMEVCWFWSWLMFLLGPDIASSWPAYAGLLLLAASLTRYMHARETPLNRQRVVTAVLASLCSLFLLRLVVYADYAWGDWSWVGAFGWELGNVMQRISPPLVVFAAGLYLWFRGISLAQRDIGVDSVGFSFRVGIAAFVWLFLAQIAVPSPRYPALAVLYFMLGLLAVGLARIEEVSQSRIGVRSPFSASWMGILVASISALLGASAGIAWLLSWHNLSRLAQFIHPLGNLLARLASPLATVVAWLLEHILDLLIRLFSRIFSYLGGEQGPLTETGVRLDGLQQPQPAQGIALLVLQILKWTLLGAVLALVLAAVAFAVHRLRQAPEDGAIKDANWESRQPQPPVAAGASNWQRLWDALQQQLARLRGQDYSLVSIRRIYASLQRLAAAAGYPRPDAVTPYEYITTLTRGFQENEREVRLITEAYVRTHYGQRSFPPEYVQEVREAWLAIRARQEERAGSAANG